MLSYLTPLAEYQEVIITTIYTEQNIEHPSQNKCAMETGCEGNLSMNSSAIYVIVTGKDNTEVVMFYLHN